MKCPNCGFISFPGNEQCKKCGHPFTQVNGPVEGIPPLFHRPGPETKSPDEPGLESESPLDRTELGENENGSLDVELEPRATEPNTVEPEEEEVSSPESSNQPGLSPWQAELADRVQEYRQRRARLHKESEHGRNSLNLDFGPVAPKPEQTESHVIEFPSPTASASSRSKAKPDFRPAPPSFGMSSFESAFLEQGGEQKEPSPPSAPPPDSGTEGPLEIELGASDSSSAGFGEDESSATSIAQMKMRFYAALIDGLVLLTGVGLYALIFWQVGGGAFSYEPQQLGAAVLIGAFFIMLYFAGCTAIASATPGLMWAGLEVITFEGNPPRFSECLWRGFGYLVSISALMLGFIWAAVDAEGLTWHDRMSRTFIVPADLR